MRLKKTPPGDKERRKKEINLTQRQVANHKGAKRGEKAREEPKRKLLREKKAVYLFLCLLLEIPKPKGNKGIEKSQMGSQGGGV